jgi:hypothetical protein
MKVVRLILGVFVWLMSITLVAELIEFLTVKVFSGMSFSELTTDEKGYFEVRNSIGILLFKILYSFLAGLTGGYLASRISIGNPKLAIYLLMGFQVLSLIWGGFFSELSQTGPTWMWIYLIIIVPAGIYFGHKISEKKQKVVQQRI